jgi:hypothetical protein
LATSSQVVLPAQSGLTTGSPYVDFLFPTSVAVNPGTTYYFQPVAAPGSGQTAVGYYNTFGYAGGMAIVNGNGIPSSDLWFREGIIVPAPEPGTWELGVAGMAALIFVRRWMRKVSS